MVYTNRIRRDYLRRRRIRGGVALALLLLVLIGPYVLVAKLNADSMDHPVPSTCTLDRS